MYGQSEVRPGGRGWGWVVAAALGPLLNKLVTTILSSQEDVYGTGKHLAAAYREGRNYEHALAEFKVSVFRARRYSRSRRRKIILDELESQAELAAEEVRMGQGGTEINKLDALLDQFKLSGRHGPENGSSDE